MKKKVISLLLITTLAISSIIGCSCSNTTDNKTSVATTTEKETEASNDDTIVETDAQGNIVVNTSTKPSSDEVTKNESSSDATSETTSGTNETSKQEEATKPQETTKPNSTTKPTETTKQEETTKAKYTYKNLDKVMYAKSTVNVRSLPSTDGDKLGSLSKGKEVKVTGQCNETNWYRIEFEGKVAYVSDSYLVAEKPVETTTAKPTTKPTTTPSTKPSQEEITKPNSSTWKPEYYTADDVVGDGLDEYRIGLQKYSSTGVQLYVKTNYTDRDNGYYTVGEYSNKGIGTTLTDEELAKKHEAFREAFEEKYAPPTNTSGYGSMGTKSLCDTSKDSTEYYMQYWNVWYGPEDTANGETVRVYNWDEARLINFYGYIMPEIASGFSSSTVEALITDYNNTWGDSKTIDHYTKGEKLAKKYKIDFHSDIERYKEYIQ